MVQRSSFSCNSGGMINAFKTALPNKSDNKSNNQHFLASEIVQSQKGRKKEKFLVPGKSQERERGADD